MKLRAWTFSTLCFLAWAAAGGPVWGQAPALSDAELLRSAARVERVFEEIERDYERGLSSSKTHVLQERDLNAFLKLEVIRRQPPGVERLAVELKAGDVFTTFLRVDLDEVRIPGGTMAGLMSALLRGTQDLELEGRLHSEQGSGRYEILGARLNGIPLPASLVSALLQAVGSRLDPPFDPTAPFEFQYGIQEIKTERGRVLIMTAPKAT